MIHQRSEGFSLTQRHRNAHRIRGFGVATELACTACWRWKPPHLYWRARGGLHNRFSRCIACCKAQKRNKAKR